MSVRIVTDSTADLPHELVEELGITVVPVYVSLNGQSYRDGIDIGPDEIYQKMADGDFSVTTSQPSPSDFANTYRHLMRETDEILTINLSSHLSGSYSSAVQGQEMVAGQERIKVVDSSSASMGAGLLAIAAARLAQAGASLPHILAETKRAVNRIHIWVVLDSLKYALRSGRLGKAKALLGSLLSVKSLITLKNGEVQPAGMMRTRQKGLEKLIANFKSLAGVEEAGIIHSTTPDEAQVIHDHLSNALGNGRLHISRLGPSLGVHTGPGTLALAVREKMPAEEKTVANEERGVFDMPSFRFPSLKIMPL